MDLNYSPEETAFRDEVRAWIRVNLDADVARQGPQLPGAVEGRPPRLAPEAREEGLGRAALARRVGGHRLDGGAALHLRGGMRRRGLPADRGLRRAHVRAGAAPLRDAGPEAAIPAADLQRRRLLGPGLLRAGLGLGPRLPQDARRPPGRPLRRHRAEDLDDPGALRRLDLLPGAHRRHPREAPGGHLLPAHRHALAGDHRAAHRAHGRRPRGQRGLLRRGEGARREPRPRGAQGLDGGQVPARLRAHGHRQHRRVQARAGPREGAGRARDRRRPAPPRRPALSRPAHAGWRSS